MYRHPFIILLFAALVMAHCGCLIEPSHRGSLPFVEDMRDTMNRRVRWSDELPYQKEEQLALYEEPYKARFKAVPTHDVFTTNPMYSGSMTAPGPMGDGMPEAAVPGETDQTDSVPPNSETLPPPTQNPNSNESNQSNPPANNPNSVMTRINPPQINSWPGLRETQEEELPGWRPIRR